jgi:hypothetical protein
MGHEVPIAIIVTASYSYDHSEDRHWIDVAHEEAFGIFSEYSLSQLVSPVVEGMVNNVRSFFIAWDGSKEGWPEDETGDEARAKFVQWLRDQAYEDGSSPLDWVEFQYGGDDKKVVALSHGDDKDDSPEDQSPH